MNKYYQTTLVLVTLTIGIAIGAFVASMAYEFDKGMYEVYYQYLPPNEATESPVKNFGKKVDHYDFVKKADAIINKNPIDNKSPILTEDNKDKDNE